MSELDFERETTRLLREENLECWRRIREFEAERAQDQQRLFHVEGALTEARQMLDVYRTQRDAAEDRVKAFNAALLKFKVAFNRYSRREHSDAHVLQPDVAKLMEASPKPATSIEWRCKCGVHNQRTNICGHCGRARRELETAMSQETL
jgi:hypothetical protein